MTETLERREDKGWGESFLINESGTAAYDATIGSVVGGDPYGTHALVIVGKERTHARPQDKALHLLKHITVADRESVIPEMSADHVLMGVTRWTGRWDEDFRSRVDDFNSEAPKERRHRITLSDPPRLDTKGRLAFHIGELRKVLEAGKKRLWIYDANLQSMLEAIDREQLAELLDVDVPSVAALGYCVSTLLVDERFDSRQVKVVTGFKSQHFKFKDDWPFPVR